MNKNKNYFKYVIIAAVLIIPFMYSFFYLKAYWNPYGKGNIDNLPVAVVNLDEGKKGNELINQIKDKKTLKLNVVDRKKAMDGLYNEDYYAIITIPNNFSNSMDSIDTNNKIHPTITYSPNQKANYLASQIIDKVVTTVEANLDNTINSEIVSTLSENIKSVPNAMDTINNGFNELSSGTVSLNEGSKKLQVGANTLNDSYDQFDTGLKTAKNGSDTLTESIKTLNSGLNELSTKTAEFETLKDSIPTLTGSIDKLTTGNNDLTVQLDNYVENINLLLQEEQKIAEQITHLYDESNYPKDDLYYKLQNLLKKDNNNLNKFESLSLMGTTINSSNNVINEGLTNLNNTTSVLNNLPPKIDSLKTGITTLKEGANQITTGAIELSNGINTLFIKSAQLKTGITSLSTGTTSLNNGINTLNSSVITAKNELNKKVTSTKEEVKKVETLKEYSAKPVKVEIKKVNEVSSYGTAFSPFFISIALWVGCLMFYIVLYYDKENRFKKLSIENKNHLQRTGLYHLLATLSGITLAILLQILLDFKITNLLLYYISIVLIANTFVAIIEFLITNFKDIGKFIALILLVLQLAAAGGTFPIETVTAGFRWLHKILPMSYTINLLKESLIKIESTLLTKNFMIVFAIFLVFLVINIVNDIRYQHKKKKA